jgi:Na+/melibiose symporter-like transporter
MIVTAIVLAIIAALCDYFFGIPEPWRKIVWVGIVILLILGVVLLLVPGFPWVGRD